MTTPDARAAADGRDPQAGEPGDVVDEADGILVEDETVDDDEAAVASRAWTGPSPRRWILFATIAIGIVVLDQLSKAWIVANLVYGDAPTEVVGDWLRLVNWRNSGILFGMLPQSAGAFAIVSLVVVGLIVVYHAKAGRGLVVTIALGLLLGGAIGNLVDRVHYGSVVDFVDMGIGTWRFYTYNIADAAISTSILLLIVMALFPRVGEWAPDG